MMQHVPYCGSAPLPGQFAFRFNLDPELIAALILICVRRFVSLRKYGGFEAAQHRFCTALGRWWSALALMAAASCVQASPQPLVVCADPNDLPFSNHALQGFENKVIELVAGDLGQPIRYVWWAQRRGYVRRTLNDSKCEIWPGMATEVQTAATTRPYYRSTYVFVTRADAPLDHLTLDDPRLKTAAIGVQMIGNDAMNTPPAHAIAERGLIDNVRGYMVYADYDRPDPTDAIIAAVQKREIDVAIVWGPLAGYYAFRSASPLRVEPVTGTADSRWPMAYDISMGVRRGDDVLLKRVNAALVREKPSIDAILKTYHVPLTPPPAAH